MKTQRNFWLGCIVLLAIISLAVGVVAAPAQNIPATAREAAALPQFAARLAHAGQAVSPANASRVPRPAKVRGANRSSSQACAQKQTGWLPADYILYSNGPANGNTDAWVINFGFVVADSFPGEGAPVTGLNFVAWLFPGDVLQSVEVSITSSPFGGTIYFDQVVSFTQQTGCPVNSYGYNICVESGNFSGPNLSGGPYWVNLQNATVNNGDPIYWDENSGPSSADENSVGTIPSESFDILGGIPSNSCMPERTGNFQVIHDFSGGQDGAGPSGVAIDSAGNLYGPAQASGGAGTVFKMAEAGTGWVMSTLYNFIGGNNGGSPEGVMIGPHGILYGAAGGGIQNCGGSNYCGLIFGLRPTPTACRSTSCGWTENALYRFTGTTDAWQGGGLVADQAGNLYGVSYGGGAQQQGAVFELSPSIGGWIESILYSFTGGSGVSGGRGPTTVLVGNDGNLYGMAEWGGAYDGGVVFQLTPSANGWTETALYDLPYMSWGWGTNPHSLLQDSAGNLFGTYQYGGCCDSAVGFIFMLAPSNGHWVFTELHHGDANLDGNDTYTNMIFDSAGNLWGTGGGVIGCMNPEAFGYIFELARTNNGWQYSTPVSWDYTYFPTGGALAMDAHGNLYGTTGSCGAHNQGTVWEFSP